jgi:hypothetical protein
MYRCIQIFSMAMVLGSLGLNNNYQQPTVEQWEKIRTEAARLIWQQAMNAKESVNQVLPNIREELLENLCSTAPAVGFTTHADLSDSLTQAENTSASVFVSTNNQSSWIVNDNVAPINEPGYENTWGATTITNGGNSVDWYLSGSIDSGSLGLEFGQVTVSQSPFNQNDSWPPSENLYAILANDDSGETGSGQDILNIKATYSEDKLYTSMVLNGGCCNEGGLFGPWYLYAVAIVNPDAANSVAYAYAYGDGGFGQLYPAIYKISGDFSSGVGEVAGFEVLSTNFNYSTAGNQLQATSLLSIITSDPDWGEWPNSFNGVGLVGVTLEAGLDGLDVAIEALDNSDIGVLVMSTQTQSSNSPPMLSNPTYDEQTGIVSVTYTDAENNLAQTREVFVEDMVFIMTPDSHTYSEGVTFSAEIGGGSSADFVFSDGGTDIVTLELDLGGNGGGCQVFGDANGDTVINVLDVVLTVNIILCADCPDNYNECSDINGDGQINILDVVSLVNIILGVN